MPGATGNPQPIPLSRIPAETDGVQLNFCKTPTCANYGVFPEPIATIRHGANNKYTMVGNGRERPAIRCNGCGESFLLKSNVGMVEERNRFRPVFNEPSCPLADCELLVGFADQSAVCLPVKNYPEFADLTEGDLNGLELGFGGSALCSEVRDLHVSIAGLVSASEPLMDMAATLIA